MLTPGTRLDVYEIIDSLGAGGMGEVHRARDTKLRREVAIKILPEVLATDPDRVARFQREAELLATLNHPHIAAIYGVDESSGGMALVLELVDGETLEEKLRHGSGPRTDGKGSIGNQPSASSHQRRALAVPDALALARQIGEALEAAHERGIVHRDLKPANVKITSAGTVKVLDFGLAKALDDPGNVRLPPDFTRSPTLTVQQTSYRRPSSGHSSISA